METLDIRTEDELHSRIKALTHQTLLSLLRTFNVRSKLFDGSTQTGESTKGSWRDTALVLVALERAVEGMSRDKAKSASGSEQSAWKNFEKDLDEKLRKFKQGKLEPISYHAYQDIVFNPTLEIIADGTPDDILDKKAERRTPVPFEDRDAFSCSCILSLLNMYPYEKAHGDVYMDALDTVLQGLVQLYPPHYMFGTASLTGTEAHAFVAYVCLRCLKQLAETVQQRAKEHESVSALLGHISDWLKQSGPIFEKYKQPDWFIDFVRAEADQLQNPVGLSAVITKLKNEVLPSLKYHPGQSRKQKLPPNSGKRSATARLRTP